MRLRGIPFRVTAVNAAAASKAAILGPVWAAALDHPADSLMLANWIGLARPVSAAASENRAVSWVHPTVSGVSFAAMVRKRSSSARHSWVALIGSPRQPRRTAPTSRGIVSSHEQIRRCLVESAIVLTTSCRPRQVPRPQPAIGRNAWEVYTDWIGKTRCRSVRGTSDPPVWVFCELEMPLSSGAQGA